MDFFRKTRKKIDLPSRRGTEGDIIRVVALTMHFGGRRILRDVDLGVRPGEIFVIMGPSGCGKTTLVKHICGLLPPDIGTVFIQGRDIYLLPEDELNVLRRRMGMAFQGGALINSMTVLDNVKLPLREAMGLPEALIDPLARVKLEMVGLLHAAHLLPGDLSGGMRKRAAIARAIVMDPQILFFDEPSAGLDPVTAAGVDNLILKLNQVFGITMVVVTHDLPSAFLVADRIALLDAGSVIALGTRQEIRQNQDPRVQQFINRVIEESGDQRMDFVNYTARTQ